MDVFIIKQKTICVIGLGYIGLPTAAMFATHGLRILGVDVNQQIVDALNIGEVIIEEPYLDTLVKSAVALGNLKASSAPSKADVFIIAVGTPIKSDKTADMSAVIAAAKSILPYLREGNTVILESTSPPGTVEDLLLPILSESGLNARSQLYVAHCPERVLPGKILIELVENNKIIGGINETSCQVVKELYKTFVKGEIFLTDATTAEMCKLMENTYRDVNIALANELALICEKLSINAWEVIKLSNKHPRVNLHLPGPGVGGHCIAVDPWFIVQKCPEDADLIKLARRTNDSMPLYIYKKVRTILGSGKKKVTLLGMTYKADVDDVRESPIIELLELLEKDGDIKISVFEPHVKIHPYKESSLEEAVENSSLIILGVNHREFTKPCFECIKKIMKEPKILDTRNFWADENLQSLGFEYHLLGNGKNS